MPPEERSSQAARPKRFRRWRRIAIGAVVLLAMVPLWLFGRGILAAWARRMAARRMSVWAISEAQGWLAWSARLDPGEAETEWMQAVCFRRLGEVDRWGKALQSAQQKGTPSPRIQQEAKLGLIQSGQLYDGAELDFDALIEAGVSQDEVATAFVRGYLVGEQGQKAKLILDAWATAGPEEAHVAYMRAFYWRRMGEPARAETELQNALARQPRHELARAALAELYENQDRLDRALEQHVALAAHAPQRETAQLGLARVLRKLGRLDEARAVLQSPAARPEPPAGVAVEMGQIELESDNYEEARQWLEQTDLDRAEDDATLSAAASTFALAGQITRAEAYCARIAAAKDRMVRLLDLQSRLAVDPRDRQAAEELGRLSPQSVMMAAGASASGTGQGREDRRRRTATSAPELYELHCAACHGADGNGNGRAARHLFPRPRDLRTGKSRLVSTLNGVPTPGDLEAVIRLGMPGTAMRAFDDLSEDQRTRLAGEVMRMNREGIRAQLVDVLRREEEEIDEDEVDGVVRLCTTPGEVVRVPPIGPADSPAIARGRDVYSRLGCDNCHGEDGRGAWDTPLFDDKSRPSPPRDLARDPFKGGHEPESIYLRVYVGMPGTPHPACYNVSQDQLIDLVHYCRSLSQEPKRTLTNHQRSLEATTPPAASTVSAQPKQAIVAPSASSGA
ncbi:MAG TPA: c-type cytochrome [Thermoguttaceae bacterium]|nr:c-type cytochrome [Thermoguttaceae bacterium]